MLDTKKLFTKILSRLVPVVLYNTKVTAPTTQSDYAYASVPNLANYNIVLVRCECNNVRELLVFCRLFEDNPLRLSDNAGTYIRGSFVVDWTNNQVGVAWLNGSSSIANLVYFQQVYGIL